MEQQQNSCHSYKESNSRTEELFKEKMVENFSNTAKDNYAKWG